VPSVLIVDDHPPFRVAARALLERGGFDVVGEAGNGDAALDAVRLLLPDVVLLDIQLPGEDGFSVCERIVSAGDDAARDPPVIVLTSGRGSSTFRRRLAASSAAGFIAKAELTAPLLRSLVAGRSRT